MENKPHGQNKEARDAGMCVSVTLADGKTVEVFTDMFGTVMVGGRICQSCGWEVYKFDVCPNCCRALRDIKKGETFSIPVEVLGSGAR